VLKAPLNSNQPTVCSSHRTMHELWQVRVRDGVALLQPVITTSILVLLMDRVKWRHSNLWSRYNLHVAGHDVVLCKVNWWRFV